MPGAFSGFRLIFPTRFFVFFFSFTDKRLSLGGGFFCVAQRTWQPEQWHLGRSSKSTNNFSLLSPNGYGNTNRSCSIEISGKYWQAWLFYAIRVRKANQIRPPAL